MTNTDQVDLLLQFQLTVVQDMQQPLSTAPLRWMSRAT